MCGIFGFITDKPSDEIVSLFKDVCIFSAQRGTDATGMAWIADDTVKINKKAVDSIKYVDGVIPDFESELAKSHVVMGHTRKWTQGKPEDNENNHPVISDTWTMVHNGCCSSMDRIKEYKYKGEVDSEIFLSYIERDGLEKGLESLIGSASIALISNEEKKSVYLWRHDNPLWVALDKQTKTIFFGSTDDILASGLANELYWFSSYQIRKIDEDVLFKVSADPLQVEEIGIIEPKKKYSYTPRGNWGNYYNHYGAYDYSGYDSVDGDTATGSGSPTRIVGGDSKSKGWKWDATRQLMLPDNVVDISDKKVEEPSPLINKYHFSKPSTDFHNWKKVDTKEKRWHESLDGLLVKIWDKTKINHFIMEKSIALKEGLIVEVEKK